jgi:hypothetical protein
VPTPGVAGELPGADVEAAVVAVRALGVVATVLAGAIGEPLGGGVWVRTVAAEPPHAGDSTSSASATVVARGDLTAPILCAGARRAAQWPRGGPLDVCMNLASALRAPGIGAMQAKRRVRQRASTPMHTTAWMEPQTAPAVTTTRRFHVR